MKLYFCSFEIKHIGVINVASSDKAVVFLSTDNIQLINYANKLKAELVESYENNITVIKQLKEYFSKERKMFSLQTKFLTGTDFQKKIWNELNNITYGKTSTYKEITSKIQYNNAFRAVGSAISQNPIPIIIPCHRVINSNGCLGGFSLGIKVKKYLLDLEKSVYTN